MAVLAVCVLENRLLCLVHGKRNRKEMHADRNNNGTFALMLLLDI
jgi:hypothetical protein